MNSLVCLVLVATFVAAFAEDENEHDDEDEALGRRLQAFLHGSAYATKLSLKVLLYLFPPPAAMTTNCLPVFLP